VLPAIVAVSVENWMRDGKRKKVKGRRLKEEG
jgi:hypothetical protein